MFKGWLALNVDDPIGVPLALGRVGGRGGNCAVWTCRRRCAGRRPDPLPDPALLTTAPHPVHPCNADLQWVVQAGWTDASSNDTGLRHTAAVRAALGPVSDAMGSYVNMVDGAEGELVFRFLLLQQHALVAAAWRAVQLEDGRPGGWHRGQVGLC